MKIAELDKRFVVRTDASKYGLGAVLLQADEVHEGKLRPVEYASRRTSSYERNYGAPELVNIHEISCLLFDTTISA